MGKKLVLFSVVFAVLAAGAFLVYQNRPSKRFARNIVKARTSISQKDFHAAREFYKKAYVTQGGYSPIVSWEALEVENVLSIKDSRIGEAVENTRLFIEKNPKNKKAYKALAEFAFQDGRLDLAFKTLETVLEIDPLYFPARYLIAQLRLKQGRPDLAESQLRILSDAFPDSLPALMPLAEVLLQQRKTSECRSVLRKILARQPMDGKARLSLLDTYILDGELDSAHGLLGEWAVKDTSLREPLGLRQARLYSAAGDFDKAIEVLSGFDKSGKEQAPLQMELAGIMVMKEDVEGALAVYDSIIQVLPDMADQVNVLKTLLLIHEGKPARALETLKQVMLRRKTAVLVKYEVLCYLGLEQSFKTEEILIQQPDSVQAGLREYISQLEPSPAFVRQLALLKYYQTIRQNARIHQVTGSMHKSWPRNEYIAEMYAEQLATLGRFPAAIQVLEEFPVQTANRKGMLLGYYFRAGYSVKGVALAQNILSKNPNSQGVNALLADYYLSQGDNARAVEYFEKELKSTPDHLPAINNLAWEYGVTQKNFEKAQPYLEKLQKAASKDPRVLDTQGWIFALNGKLEAADSLLHLAVNLFPDNPSILYHTGYVKAGLGKKQDAKKLLEKAVSLRAFKEKGEAEKLLESM